MAKKKQKPKTEVMWMGYSERVGYLPNLWHFNESDLRKEIEVIRGNNASEVRCEHVRILPAIERKAKR